MLLPHLSQARFRLVEVLVEISFVFGLDVAHHLPVEDLLALRLDLEAFEWFWLLGFSSWHGWAMFFVACEKDTSESSASE